MKKTKKNAKKSPAKKAPAKKAPAKKAKPAKKAAAPRKAARPAPNKIKSVPAKVTAKPLKPAVLKAAKPGPGADTLTKNELAEIAASLSEMKTDISKNVEDKREFDLLEPEVGDSIDQASQSLDKEILFELSDNERRILRDIDAALRKLEKGTYGLCEHCKKPIQKKRIKALPSARYCLSCQSGSERSSF